MELHQQVVIPVARDQVWQSLNDPAALKACLPGCETFEESAPGAFDMTLTAKVGPVKTRFHGQLQLSDIQAPVSYTISGEGKGGVAGFAKGAAKVQLEALDGARTLMTYSVSAAVGGKLAQIGSRLVSGAASKMADDFFREFVRHVTGDPAMEVTVEAQEKS